MWMRDGDVDPWALRRLGAWLLEMEILFQTIEVKYRSRGILYRLHPNDIGVQY